MYYRFVAHVNIIFYLRTENICGELACVSISMYKFVLLSLCHIINTKILSCSTVSCASKNFPFTMSIHFLHPMSMLLFNREQATDGSKKRREIIYWMNARKTSSWSITSYGG